MAKKKVESGNPPAGRAGLKVESEVPAAPASMKKDKESKWAVLGWVLLLFGGLGHMLPEQMAPLLKLSLWGVSLQMAVGVVAVILALNFLLED